MNWKEISEKYPKAFNKFFKWYWPNERQSFDGNDLYFCQTVGDENYAECSIPYESFCEIRKFYDFFDEQEIFIEIEFYPIPESPKKPWTCNGTIFEGNDLHLKWCSEEYIKRSDAEEATFMKAFEILEKELNKKHGNKIKKNKKQ